jgi:hypothetical protein
MASSTVATPFSEHNMTQNRAVPEGNPIERAIRKLKDRLAAKPVQPYRFSDESYAISATAVGFITSKTFKQMWRRMSNDRTTEGTIALAEATHLCAVAWHAGREAAKHEQPPISKSEYNAFAHRVAELTERLN